MSPTAMAGTWQMMDGGMGGGMMWIGGVFGLVVTLLLLAALALVVVWLWQTVRDAGRSNARRCWTRRGRWELRRVRCPRDPRAAVRPRRAV